MAEASTIFGRVKTSVGGLFITALSLVFVVAGIGMVVKSAHRAATYLPATATVEKITGAGVESDRITVSYFFVVQGKRYSGEESVDEKHASRFKEIQQLKVGQDLTVYYNPSDPAQSQCSVKADATGLAFTIFAMPFLVLGLNPIPFK